MWPAGLASLEKLVNGLSGERTRWEADVERLNTSKTAVYGDCLLSAAFLSYLDRVELECEATLEAHLDESSDDESEIL